MHKPHPPAEAGIIGKNSIPDIDLRQFHSEMLRDIPARAVQAKPKGITVLDIKHLALQQCLVANYKARTPEGARSAPSQDASFMIERYALDNAGVWKAFQTFVAKETKDFDRLTMSLHPDHAQTANNVLEQCMNFYESDKLDKYVRGTVMK